MTGPRETSTRYDASYRIAPRAGCSGSRCVGVAVVVAADDDDDDALCGWCLSTCRMALSRGKVGR